MNNIYIVAATRTPIAKYLGSFKTLTAVDLGSILLKSTLDKYKITADSIDQVIVGNVLSSGLGQGPARQIAKNANIDKAPAYCLNMVCGSGMRAIADAYCQIKAGMNNLVVAMGSESMSNTPFLLDSRVRNGRKMGDLPLVDTLLYDALIDAFNNIHMGITAENIAKKFNISREEQDKFAYNSHQKSLEAIKNESFKDEIIPIMIRSQTISQDESPRSDVNIETLSHLKPAFAKDDLASVTAGNSSSLNDGAALTIVANEDSIKKYNLQPLVRIVAFGQSTIDPTVMGLGPVDAIKNALDNANLTINDIDIIELNEAFASQSLGVVTSLADILKISKDDILAKTNMNGGAISLGHPLGASGTRIVVTLIHLLKKHNKRYGLASLCIGGGHGYSYNY